MNEERKARRKVLKKGGAESRNKTDKRDKPVLCGAQGAASGENASVRRNTAGRRRALSVPAFVRGALFDAAVTAERALPLSAVSKGIPMLLTFLMALLFSRAPLPFSVYPLGIGFLAGSVMYLPSVAAGVFAGAMSLGQGGYIYAALTVLIAAVRLLVPLFSSKPRTTAFEASRGMCIYLSAIAGFACGIYNIIRHGYRYYDLLGSFLLIVLCPLFTYTVQLAVSGDSKRSKGSNLWCCGVFIGCLIFSLKSIELLGVSVAQVAALAVTLFTARRLGVLYGTAAGTLMGLAGAPASLHVFAVAGFCAGLLDTVSVKLACALAVASSVVAAYMAGGGNGLLDSLPGIVWGASLYYLGERFGLLSFFDRIFETGGEEQTDADAAEVDCKKRFEALSESFRSLSEVCYALSDRYRRPDEAELRAICTNACDKYCKRCRTSPLCWNREYSSTADVMSKVVSSLSSGKKVRRSNLPPYFTVRCPSVDGIINDINAGCAALVRSKLSKDRTEVLAMDYEAIAALMTRALEINGREHRVDRRLSALLQAECADILGKDCTVTVTGSRRMHITAGGKGVVDPRVLQKRMEKLCKCRLSLPVCNVENGRSVISAHSIRRLGVKMAFLSRPKEKSGECGDSVSVFENREDYYYSMISDGMGSGSEAALTSGVCAVFLKKMLSAGNAKDITIEMLNDLVRCSEGECSATVDLFELDMIRGKASFIKSGAAPSFVKRGGRLFRIQSKTLPIGIVRAAEAEQVSFDAEIGDIIIMQSDGVAQSYEDCPWLLSLLTVSWTDDLPVMCSRILDAAEKNNGEKDDRSVCILKIVDGGR